MLRHPTIDKLQQLKLPAMARELTEQRALPEASALSFEEPSGAVADRELAERSNRRLALKLRHAMLRHCATLEDLDTVRGKLNESDSKIGSRSRIVHAVRERPGQRQ